MESTLVVKNPVLMEVIGHSLITTAEEMSVVIQRTAYSSIVREALDYSTALFDDKGNLISQSDNCPNHLGLMSLTLKRILNEFYPKSMMNKGDQIIVNHPYIGTSHTPDILLIAPVFVGEELFGFCGSMCHHADVGGSTPGSSPGDSTDLYQEGLLIPPLKLYDRGVPNETLFTILKSNFRMPEYTIGDLNSQISANHIGQKRLVNLCEKYGLGKVREIIKEWLDYSEVKISKRIKSIPDGIYRASGHMDDDGVDKNIPIPIDVCIEVKGDKIIYDFTDSSPQVRGPFNVVIENVWSVAYYITRCLTDADVPQNEGAFRPVEVKLKKGTIFNPIFPAPVSGRYHTVLRLSEICLEAFSQALPHKIPASSHAHTTSLAIGGFYKERNKYFVYYELNGGGMGARPNKDGLSGIEVHMGNCMNVPIEAAELEYPVRFKRYELIPDSGGAGKYRGGLGIVRDIQLLSDNLTITVRSDGETTDPKGLFGGENGLPGKVVLNPNSADERPIYRKANRLRLDAGNVISIQTPGSGGYGDPLERDENQVISDWLNGYITEAALKTNYQLNSDVE